MEDSRKEQLFGKLFGFRVGDRVKVKTERVNGKGSYWQYGKVVHVNPHATSDWAAYRVIFDNDKWAFRIGFNGTDLVRVRKYAKSGESDAESL